MKGVFSLIILTFSFMVSAQIPIWTEDFGDGDLPTNWTTVDASGQVPYGFGWTQDGNYFSTQPVFAAATAGNGFMLFNSDSVGSLNLPHDIRLTTDAIDCSTLSTVQVNFSNQYAFYSQGNVSITELGVSTDGTNFTYFPILQSVLRNDLTNTLTIENVNITSIAAGQSTVYLQFRWQGNFEYSWRIDDVSLGALLLNDMAILEDSHAGASSSIMPEHQTDSIRFLASIANIGSNPQTDVTLEVEVIETNTTTVVHSQTHNFGTMAPGDTIRNYAFPQSYLPVSNPQLYTINYNLSTPTTVDYNLTNNSYSNEFEISTDEFLKTSTFNVGITPSTNNSWTSGTQFYIYKGSDFSTTQYANTIKFGVTNASSTNSIIGFPIEVLLEKGIDANNNGLIESSERILVATGSHTFSTADIGIIIDVPITAADGSLYELESNTSYLVSAKYNTTGNESMFLLMNDELSFFAANTAAQLNGQHRYSHYLDIGNTGNYDYINNFSNNPIPAIGLGISAIPTTTNSTELEENSLIVFPNPVEDYLTATIDLESVSKNATIIIYNIQGQILTTHHLSNVQKEEVKIDLNHYNSGTYLISVTTDSGHTIKRFIVKK
jgi:hypothetical protein